MILCLLESQPGVEAKVNSHRSIYYVQGSLTPRPDISAIEPRKSLLRLCPRLSLQEQKSVGEIQPPSWILLVGRAYS